MPRPVAQFPRKLQFLFQPHRYKVCHGGRGSGKSWGVARSLLILGASTSIRILCGREYQKSIQDSVHKLLSDQIEALNLQQYYHILQYEIRSRVNGTRFIFEGLHANVTKVKSMEGINIAWVEEAEKVTKSSWDTLIPTLRTEWFLPVQFWQAGTVFTPEELDAGGRMVDPEIWVTYNPDEETDETHQRFVVKPPPPGAKVVQINWRDNPFFPRALLAEKDHLAATDPDAYLHIWEGQCRKMSAAQVLRGKWRMEHFEPEAHWSGPYFGTDWGFATDPNASTKSWIDESTRTLYVEHEAYGLGTETDDLPALLKTVPGAVDHVNRADNARPETISYCRRHGHPRIVACEKWPGSVEDGVNYLRQEFDAIVIHPRCVHTIEEAKLWSYKVDKNTQDVLPVLEDKHNHCWDSIRYALGPLIKGKVKLTGVGFRTYDDATLIHPAITVRMVTVTAHEVTEGAAEFTASFQFWGARGGEAMYLLSETLAFGALPEIIDELLSFWTAVKDDCPVGGGVELWAEAKAFGPTFLKMLRSKGLPAREWLPKERTAADTPDMTIMEPEYRRKLASVHIAAGRVFVPVDSALPSELEGLATNAMTLALLIWQQRGGGVGPVPT